MLRKAMGPLIDESLSAQDLATLEARISLYPGISMHSVRSRRSGRTKYIDFHLAVPETMSVGQSHEVCDEIERSLAKEISNSNVLIHIEPVLSRAMGTSPQLSKDELLLRLAELGRGIAGYDVRPHHLHLFDGPGGTEISFHVDLESGSTLAEAHRLASEIEAGVKRSLGLEATVHTEPRREP